MSYLKSVPTTGKMIQLFMNEFVVKKNEVSKIMGKPTCTTVKPLVDAIVKNLIGMYDARDPLFGKLHLIDDRSQLVGGPAQQVLPSVDQEQPIPYVAPTIVQERKKYLHDFHEDQENWLDDQNAEESLKNLVISRVNEVYLDELKELRFQYKGKILQDFLDLLINDFQATPEELAAVKKLIKADWNPNQHIIKLFKNLKEHLTTLGEMKNANPYSDEDFIEALYMAVHKSKQSTKACAKWKRKPFVKRSAKAQARSYFKDVYEIFDAKCDSFHEIGVANNVVMQEKMDSLAAENAKMGQEMAADQAKNAKYHQVIETAMSMTQATESDRDDTTLQTQFLAFTASQAQNMDSQFADLRQQLEQCMSR